MDGISIDNVSLHLTKIPGRKRYVFCFMDGSTMYPVAYTQENTEDIAIEKWNKMLDGIGEHK